MPVYEFRCKWCDQEFEKLLPIADWDKKQPCVSCGRMVKKLISVPVVYGTVKFHDKAFADATEAAGRPIRSTKEVDAAEKAGEFYAITNPSRARKFKEKK